MEIVETLNEDLIDQLSSIYQKTWFTQDRNITDITTMLENSYLILGFVEDGEMIGFCRAISDGVYKAFLFDVIIKDEYQNKGFGSLIIDTVVNHQKLINVKHIELYCPETITPFYKKLGFETRTSLFMRYDKKSI